MAADRKAIAPSNTPGVIAGTPYLNDMAEEIAALWRYASVPLSTVAGTANAITADCDVPLAVREKGNRFTLTPIATNTGAVTLAINGLAAKDLKSRDGAALAAARLGAGRLELVEDVGAHYAMVTDRPASTAAPLITSFAYQLAANTNGANVALGWQDYPLNTTLLSEIPGISFASPPTFILPAGNYEVDAFCTAQDNNFTALHMWDDTAAAPVLSGLLHNHMHHYGFRRVFGKLNVPTTRSYRLRLFARSGGGTLGLAANITSPASVPEQYGGLVLKVYP